MIFLQFFMGLFAAAGLAAAAGGSGGNDTATKDTQSHPGKPATPPIITDDTPDDEPVIVDNGSDGDTQTPPVGSGDNEEEPQDQIPGGNSGEPPVIVPPDGNSGGDDPATSGETVSLPASGASIDVTAGRVTTLDAPDSENIASVRILELPEHGNITVNPDNTLALVLSDTDYTGNLSFRYEATYKDGTVTEFENNVEAYQGPEAGGWGLGQFYMLETDENDDLVIEYGENHREVYVSNSDDALSISDVAALEGLKAEDITASWLEDHPEYGGSEDMALKPDAGMALWNRITDRDAEPNSHWLLIERGYEYDDLGRMVGRGAMGESELHPMRISSYGEGETPLIKSGLNIYQSPTENIVIHDLAFTDAKVQVLTGDHVLMDNLVITGDETNIQNVEGFTFRNSAIYDVIRDEPVEDGATEWNPAANRISGIFIKNSEGVLIENSFFDHNSWGEGYDYGVSADDPQPPSFYSHNVYIQKDNLDVTFRDNITMRAASFGAQIRPGGFIEDNIFLDNNAGVNFNPGLETAEDGVYSGNYSLFTDNVVTSGAHKTVDKNEGALTMGINYVSRDATLIDNIVAHLADPNNPDEQIEKYIGHDGLKAGTVPYYDDTMIYNWIGQKNIDEDSLGRTPDQNIDGLNTTTLDQTTIQNFTAQLLDKETATIGDLADYLRAQANGDLDHYVDADLIIKFFQTGFGITPDLDETAETFRFVPNDLGDGVRWDNRLNWDQQYLPGTGQNVDLAGNWVYYGGTARIEDLDFGSGGKLYVSHGYLQVSGDLEVGDWGGELKIDGAGQFWTDGYHDGDLLTVNAEGGRFANTGDFDGHTDIEVSDNAQAILATGGGRFDLSEGSSLEIVGDDAKVGFDGDDHGTAVLRFDQDSTVSFTSEEGKFGSIEEFRSGHYGDAPDVLSGVHLGDAKLALDFSEITGAYSQTLIASDMLVGTFGEIDTIGLGNGRDATITVDYENDTVTVSLTEAGKGTGKLNYDVLGEAAPAAGDADDAALWAALTDGHGTYSDEVPDEEPEDDEMPLLHVA